MKGNAGPVGKNSDYERKLTGDLGSEASLKEMEQFFLFRCFREGLFFADRISFRVVLTQEWWQ